MLNFVNEKEEKNLIEEFHVGECGGNHYWKATVNNIMRIGLYWPTIFSNTHKEVSSCHKCQIFEGRRNLFQCP